MTKHMHILLWVPLIYAALFLVYWIRIYQNDYVEFDEYVLNKQANYAADSAIEELLVASDLNQDYADGDYVTLEPKLALSDFGNSLCLDFGYIPTEKTLLKVWNDNIRAMVICVYDGIYYYYLQQDCDDGSMELVQSPKVPYFYTDESGNQMCLNLMYDKGYYGVRVSDTEYKLHNYGLLEDVRPIDDVQKTAVNNQVSDILNWCLYESYSAGKKQTLRLPALAETVRGEQPVQSPTVIAVIEGNANAFSQAVTAECIGGAQLEAADHVIGFTFGTGVQIVHDSGVINNLPAGKYYAYSSWWDENKSKFSGNLPTNNAQYFDTVFEAAKAGYNDLSLIK